MSVYEQQASFYPDRSKGCRGCGQALFLSEYGWEGIRDGMKIDVDMFEYVDCNDD